MSHEVYLDGARQILETWKSEHIAEIVKIIETGLREESDTAIDGAKCLVEAVCKTILAERGEADTGSDSPDKLMKRTTQVLEIADGAGGDNLLQMIRGMTNATNGLESLRNRFGPLGHGRDAQHAKLGDWHRLMAVRTAETISVLLFEAHCARAVNLKYSRLPFDPTAPINEAIDRLADVQIDPDTYEIVINEAFRFRPSQILYDFDREGYADECNKAADFHISGDDEEQ